MVKVVSLSEKAYHGLKGLKHKGESFSDIILKLLKKESSILNFAGIWKETEFNQIFQKIEKDRTKFRTRNIKIE